MLYSEFLRGIMMRCFRLCIEIKSFYKITRMKQKNVSVLINYL